MNAVVCRESDPVSWPGFRNWVPKICPQMFTGPVGPFEVFFTGPKLILRIFTCLGPAVHC